MRLMSSVGSQHGSGSGRGSKRQRTTPNGFTVPGSGSGDDPSSFRPDSQFAAVPQLPGEAGEAQTGGGSGDEEGSGAGDVFRGGKAAQGQGVRVGFQSLFNVAMGGRKAPAQQRRIDRAGCDGVDADTLWT